MTLRCLPGVLCLWAVSATAQDLALPSNAVETFRTSTNNDSYSLATGPWAAGAVPRQTAEGTVTTTAWRIPAPGVTTLQMLRPLRDQLAQAQFETLFSCDTQDCGGFDFRFAIDILPPPDMQVDLGDFRYLAATKDTANGTISASILVSRTARTGYVQLVQIGPPDTGRQTTNNAGSALRATPAAPPSFTGPLSVALDSIGRTVLTDLAFDTGAATLATGSYASLQDLSAYLAANPDLTVALVGHTDAEGSLEGNIALSRRRARSVLDKLVTDYDVPSRQLEAQGMGYLSPIANNRTAEGRQANRRVEVIVTSTQ